VAADCVRSLDSGDIKLQFMIYLPGLMHSRKIRWSREVACREGKSTSIAAHSGTVRSVNFASNGRMLMSSSDDKTVKVWSLPSQRFMFTLSGHMNWVRTAQFSPDCRLAVSGSDDKSMRIWDIQSKRLLRIYDEHSGVISSVDFHPDGTCVASAGTDKVIKVWDIRCAYLPKPLP
jgi:centriolar protein POC1